MIKCVLRQTILLLAIVFGLMVGWLLVTTVPAEAANITTYSDTISDSRPGKNANHSLAFTLGTDVSPGGYIEVTPPPGFTILSTSTFAASRNVELVVNGTPRTSAAATSPGVDGVTITTGSPGLIRYTLNPSAGLSSGDELQLLIGNQTSKANVYDVNYSTSTGTTTTQGDVEPIKNAATTGNQTVDVRVYDGGEVAGAEFLITLVAGVGVGPVDTTETVPPYRFNGSPTSTVGGTTPSVEISLETDELAVCRYSTTTDVAYAAMTNTFSNTGVLFHSQVVSVTPDSVQRYYVRCIDDEGNFNIDDYPIVFTVNEVPTGDINDEGDTSGDGSGSGDAGSGDGEDSDGSTGGSDGQGPDTDDGSSNSGGSGGGGGGSSGDDDEDESGGGFESDDEPYLSGDGQVIINGYAFPRSDVVALVDGTIAEEVSADSNGRYSITLADIARGVYTFGVYGVDDQGVKSSTFSTSFTVTGALTTSLSNVNVVPSISVDPDPVDPGQPLTISGYSLPEATITLENQKDGVSQSLKTSTVVSDDDGFWTASIDTSNFSVGTYKVRAQAEQGATVKTAFSNYTFYGVGEAAEVSLTSDLNQDSAVNLTDFSILLFWWGDDGGASSPSADINGDGTVNLTDFSILLFNWTG